MEEDEGRILSRFSCLHKGCEMQPNDPIYTSSDIGEAGMDAEWERAGETVEDTQSIGLGETGGPHHESAIVFPTTFVVYSYTDTLFEMI
jgi:hypothetical protein